MAECKLFLQWKGKTGLIPMERIFQLPIYFFIQSSSTLVSLIGCFSLYRCKFSLNYAIKFKKFIIKWWLNAITSDREKYMYIYKLKVNQRGDIQLGKFMDL